MFQMSCLSFCQLPVGTQEAFGLSSRVRTFVIFFFPQKNARMFVFASLAMLVELLPGYLISSFKDLKNCFRLSKM